MSGRPGRVSFSAAVVATSLPRIPSKQTNRMHNLVSVVTRKKASKTTARLGFPRHPLYIRSFACLLAITFHHVNRLERSEKQTQQQDINTGSCSMGHANAFDAVAWRRACRLMLESSCWNGGAICLQKASKRFQPLSSPG